MQRNALLSGFSMFKRRKPRPGKVGENPLASRVVRGDDRPTEPLPGDSPAKRNAAADRHPSPDPTRTAQVPLPGGSAYAEEPATRLVTSPNAEDGVSGNGDDLPVGALLVIRGPGRGTLLPVGPGMSSIGRGVNARLRVDFGDGQIAHDHHALLTHDPGNRRFILQQGDGPVTLDGQAVAGPVEIKDGARLRVGATEFLFRSLFLPHVHDSGSP